MEYKSPELIVSYKTKVEEHRLTMFNPIIKYLGNIAGKRILDVGCGSGDLAKRLSKNAGLVVGIDSSEEWVVHCKNAHHAKNLEFLCMNVRNLGKFGDGSFDIVIMNMVLPNVHRKSDVEKIFSEVGRVLKNSGELVFS